MSVWQVSMKLAWQRWQQVASRITGVSLPIFGISWNPPLAQRTAAARAITDFESRGLLYTDFQSEMPD